MSNKEPENELVHVEDITKHGSRATQAGGMWLAGAPYQEIAERLNYANVHAAQRAVELAMSGTIDEENRKQVQKKMSMQLDRLARSAWTKAIDPQNPEQLAAIKTVTGVLDRKAKLLGLDEPSQVAVHTPAQQELQNWIDAILENKHGNLPQEADVVDGEVIDNEEVGREPGTQNGGP